MATYSIEAAEADLEGLVDRALAGEAILIMSESGKLFLLEPIGDDTGSSPAEQLPA